jgi:regulator of sigma E protease
MELLTGAPHYILSFLILLTVVVFIHELGHFSVARLCGVRVEVFSLGFGSELFGFTDRHGTRWKVSALPLGGYVKMFGQAERIMEADGRERDMSAAEKLVSFHHKAVWQRAAIVFAGPAANFVLTIAIFAVLFASLGQPFTEPVIGAVRENSAAASAGLRPGDRILSLDGNAVQRFDEIADALQLNLNNTLDLGIERDGQQLHVAVTPQVVEEKDIFGNLHKLRRLGIESSGKGQLVRYDPLTSVWVSVQETYRLSAKILVSVWQMAIGARPGDELGGVLRIGKVAGDVAQLGVLPFIDLMAQLSINLGLLNLFPIPLLDGGHLAFFAIESVRGRPLGERAQEWGMRIGMAVVLGLMLFATWNDLVSFKVVEFIKNLVT